MRIPNAEHTSRPWRIHEIAHDFRLEDVWTSTEAGSREDFPRLVQMVASADPSQHPSFAIRALFSIRWKLGELFGWDDPDTGVGARVQSLRDRVPADLRGSVFPSFDALPFTPLYMTDSEFAAEVANKTMHGIMHLGWVPDGAGAYRVEMAVYVRPNGIFGDIYMAAIRPFRYLIVYPRLMRHMERTWRESFAQAKEERL
jgi:hypothetical protein